MWYLVFVWSILLRFFFKFILFLNSTIVSAWTKEVVSKQNCRFAFQHFWWIFYQGRCFSCKVESGGQNGEGLKEYPKIADDLNLAGLMGRDVVLRLQIITRRFASEWLELGIMALWGMALILWGKFSRCLGFTLTQNVNHMENLPDMCGSSPFLFICVPDNDPFPSGPDARSGFWIIIFCTSVNL